MAALMTSLVLALWMSLVLLTRLLGLWVSGVLSMLLMGPGGWPVGLRRVDSPLMLMADRFWLKGGHP